MKVILPSAHFVCTDTGPEVIQRLEKIGRVCYKSEDKITPDSAKKFVQQIIKNGHHSVLEHVSITVRFICDRGVSHEVCRHRIASYSMESTRYCRYDGEKEGSELTFIKPCFFKRGSEKYKMWEDAMERAEDAYLDLLSSGASPQEARSVLPNSLKTELYMTANMREWRHFFNLRCAKAAHPQMRELTIPLLHKMDDYFPVLFDDLRDMYATLPSYSDGEEWFVDEI
jgi:thymidylate synthase (FAD)